MLVHRNIANLVPPYEYLTEHSETIAAIEFGITALNIKNIVILGHSGCGGIKSGYHLCKDDKLDENTSIANWLKLLLPAYKKLSDQNDKDAIGSLEKISIITSIDNLKSYPFIKRGMETNEIKIFGLWNDIGSGNIHAYNSKTNVFEII